MGENDFIIDEKFIKHLFEQLPGMVVTKDTLGNIVSYNEHFKQFNGIKSDISGLTDYDLYKKQEANEITHIDREVIRSKEVVASETVIDKDNVRKYFLSYTAPIIQDDQPIGTSSISLDMTERENKVQDQLRILKDIVLMLPGHVYWKGRDNRYLGCNYAQAKALGLAHPDDIIGRLSHERMPSDLGNELRAADAMLMEEGRTITLEEPGIRDDGAQGTFLTKKTPLYDGAGDVVGLLGVSFDITVRKRQEKELEEARDELERANQLKSDFMSNMEHDIRSPFSAIAVFCGWLRDEEEDPYKRQVLTDVVNAGDELLKLCNDTLDFSKLEKERHYIDKKVDLRELIDKIERLERVVASVNKLEFHIDYDVTIPKVLVGDPFKIFRILVNLLSNAFKFTEEGAVLLNVECLKKDRREALIRFTVKDSGIGMPADKQHYVFERFSRLSRSHHGLYKGLGVGLPIVKMFVEDLDGEIDLVSEEGEGTTIACTIPFRLPLTQDYVDHSFIHKLVLD
jgi:PAS domain S-box-containing protein